MLLQYLEKLEYIIVANNKLLALLTSPWIPPCLAM